MNDSVRITDHFNRLLDVDLAKAVLKGMAVRPDHLDLTPARIGSEWIVECFRLGVRLELWRRSDGLWFALDPDKREGVVLNLDQVHDLRPLPRVTVEAGNYRALVRTVWTPTRVCSLVGPNGSGKSTLFSLLAMFRHFWLRGASETIASNHGAFGLRSWRSRDDDPVVIALTVDELRWELQLIAQGATVSDRPGEKVTLGGEPLLSRDPLSTRVLYRGKEYRIPENDSRMAIRFVFDQQDRGDDLDALVRVLPSIRVYQDYEVSTLKLNGSRSMGDLYLHPGIQNALAVLRNWRDRRDLKVQYQFVLDGLRSAFPEVSSDIEFEVAGQTTTINLIHPASQIAFPISLAPNGWVAGLVHLMAVAGAQKGSIVAIDDFGDYLHPYAIREIVRSIRDWAESRDLRVCLATHSPVLLNEFADHPESVFVMDSGEDERPLPLTSLYDDPAWLARFSLGRLYEHGEFGGQRPVSGHAQASVGE
jgi:predicted ATPase